MDNKASVQSNNRSEYRVRCEPGATIIVHSGDREIVGTIENKSDRGICLEIPESFQNEFGKDDVISLTYSMPYGLVSQQVQVCWSKPEQKGGMKVGALLVQGENEQPTNYQRLWKEFLEAEKPEDGARLWLSLQSAMISGVTRGVIVLGHADNRSFKPVSFWPEGQRGTLGLTEVAEMALQQKRAVLKDDGQQHSELNFGVCYIGYPLIMNEKLFGVVAFEVAMRPESMMRAVMRQIQWGASWIELFLRRIESKKFAPEDQQLITVLELIATSLEHEKFQSAATGVVTELASLLECERVSLGFVSGKYIQVRAMSHTADFTKKSKLVQSIGSAMDEAMDQQDSLVFPAFGDSPVKVLKCHEKLSREQGDGAVCTVPLSNNGVVFGALTLEFPAGRPFNKRMLNLCETIASLVGPILETKRLEDRWLITKGWSSLKEFFGHLLGPAHAGLKLGFLLTVAMALFFVFATGQYRVSADTYLEGAIQRTIVTPFDGYIDEAYVRAGDKVKKGMTLAVLDDSDLVIEKSKWRSQKEQFLKEYRDALGKADRSKASISQSQLRQAEAQLELVETQLSRIKLKAPFDGFVVSGDLSQSLGSPSQRGDVLFEIAPLNDYRVILEVDERDIADLRVGQSGVMVLTGRSEIEAPFNVTHITPVSESKEGRTYFRVEAKLEQNMDFLRPGMKGIGKIEIGERKLIWIWTRYLIDWMRLTFWTWWPQGL